MADFDPYRKWLGIPPEEQPPSHYRLLGIGPFESDHDVISNAADRQMVHLRTFQTGKHADLSQKLLNELAAARLCLLDSSQKVAYDGHLRREATSAGPPPPPSAAALATSLSAMAPPSAPPLTPPPPPDVGPAYPPQSTQSPYSPPIEPPPENGDEPIPPGEYVGRSNGQIRRTRPVSWHAPVIIVGLAILVTGMLLWAASMSMSEPSDSSDDRRVRQSPSRPPGNSCSISTPRKSCGITAALSGPTIAPSYATVCSPRKRPRAMRREVGMKRMTNWPPTEAGFTARPSRR